MHDNRNKYLYSYWDELLKHLGKIAAQGRVVQSRVKITQG